ncbi:hypothetical protein BAE44_0024508 [Dichanthelium oligosanthes]|uniref:Peptidase A1 domain-containing protein n=1 Tax=Dichanthelium oligosanthes TaxID=888268 RepID=A0A1E5UNL9_9POAL|nr:hypothetical protein BAE44_0024508 [Dichanthelium oligosanthes]
MNKLALLVALLAAALAVSCSDAAGGAIRKQLTRADAGRGLTRRQLLRRMARRSKARVARLLSLSDSSSSSAASVSAVPGKGQVMDTEYLVSFAIGTPAQPVQVTLDTGSDLIWTQCQPCPSCYAQALPYYDPSLSATSAVLHCNASACQQIDLSSCGTHEWGNQTCVYTYFYGDKSLQRYRQRHRRLRPWSPVLPSQLKVGNFSYCFTNITGSTPNPVLLGLPAELYSGASGAVQTTPLIQSSSAVPTFYYLSLKSITVGSTRLPVPESAFALTSNDIFHTAFLEPRATSGRTDLVFISSNSFSASASIPFSQSWPMMLLKQPTSIWTFFLDWR